MKTYTYDGSFNGFLSLISACYHQGSMEADIFILAGTNSLYPGESIATDTDKASRMKREIAARISRETYSTVRNAFLAEVPHIENAIYSFLKTGFEKGANELENLSLPEIALTLKAARRTEREYHRFLGLLRFETAANNFLYARIAPDTNLLPLLGRHFKERYPEPHWCIHDTGRDTALFYRNGEFYYLRNISSQEKKLPVQSSQDLYQRMWREYFKVMGIESRRNPGLQQQFVPLKHRRYLSEFGGDPAPSLAQFYLHPPATTG